MIDIAMIRQIFWGGHLEVDAGSPDGRSSFTDYRLQVRVKDHHR